MNITKCGELYFRPIHLNNEDNECEKFVEKM